MTISPFSLGARHSLIMTLACLSLVGSSLYATTYTVTDPTDTTSSYVNGQLRYAIFNATSGSDIIQLNVSPTLSGNMPNSTASYTMQSDSASTTRTIDGGSAHNLFNIDTNGVKVTLTSDIAPVNIPSVSISRGSLSISANQNLSGTGPINLSNAGTLEINYSGGTLANAIPVGSGGGTFNVTTGNHVILSGEISGSTDSLVKTGPGTLILSNVNNAAQYAGDFIIKQGKLCISHKDQLGANGVTFDPIDNTATFHVLTAITIDKDVRLANDVIFDSDADIILTGGVSGTGTLIKTGNGTLVLAGNASYDDSTTINEGIIEVSSASFFGGAGHTLTLDGGGFNTTSDPDLTTIVLGQITVSSESSMRAGSDIAITVNTITGAGNFIKTGPGVLTLTPTTYSLTGEVAIPQGTLAIKPETVAGTGNFRLNGGTLQFITSAEPNAEVAVPFILVGSSNSIQTDSPVTISANISGTGSFAKKGSSTLTFSGTNAHSGGTTIEAGTLIISDSSHLGTGTLTFNGGHLTITGASSFSNDMALSSNAIITTSADATISGTISGGNTLTKAGTSKLTLLGTNINTGAITISQGTLQGTTSSLASDIVNNTTLIFNQNFDGTYAGSVSGTGNMTIDGGGTITLSGNNTLQGQTTVNAGKLVVNSQSLPGNAYNTGGVLTTLGADEERIINNASLEFNQATDGSYGGVISGTGAVIKTGAGRLNLVGNHTYTGPTTVSTGALAINGSVTSDVTVASGASLEGTGTITGNVIAYGTMAPGNSIGTTTITGNHTFASGSTYTVEISPTASDLIQVTGGSVTIEPNTTFALEPSAGTYSNDKIYTVITVPEGQTINGTFDTITVSPSTVLARLFYEDTSVKLFINTVTFQQIVGTGNAGSVATALDTVFDSGQGHMDTVYETLVLLDDALLPGALDQLHPAALKGMTIIEQNLGSQVLETVNHRFQAVLDHTHCPGQTKERKNHIYFWGDVFGSVLNQGTRTIGYNQQAGYHGVSEGFVTGADYHYGKYFYSGALLGYSHSHIKWKLNRGSGNTNNVYGGFYTSIIGKRLYANISLLGAWNHFSAERIISYPGESQTALSSRNGAQLLSHIDTGINLGHDGFTIRPFDSLDYIYGNEESFSETNAGALSLNVSSSDSSFLRNELGLQFAKCLRFTKSAWTFDAKLSWIREMRLDGDNTTAAFSGGSSVPFTTTGFFPTRNLFSPGAGITTSMLDERLVLNLYYNAQLMNKYNNQNFGFNLGYKF